MKNLFALTIVEGMAYGILYERIENGNLLYQVACDSIQRFLNEMTIDDIVTPESIVESFIKAGLVCKSGAMLNPPDPEL